MHTRRPLLSVCLAVALVVLLLSPLASSAPRIRSPCTACQTITDVLRQRMQEEKPRNHLDMRHRLDEQGKRYGKVIDYKISELRAVELLDGVCDKMREFIAATFKISESGRTTVQWARWMGSGSASGMINSTRFENHEESALQKELQIYCGAVMEEWEEDLEAAIMSGKFEEDLDALDTFLCTEKVKACPDGTVPRAWIDEPPPPPAPEAEGAAGTEAAPADAAATATEAAPGDAAGAEGSPAPEAGEAAASKQEL